METVKQKVTWAAPHRAPVEVTLTHQVKTIGLDNTRLAFSVPANGEDIIIRSHKGRLYRQRSLPELVASSQPTLEKVAEEVFAPLDNAFSANGILWVQCSEPGYGIRSTPDSVSIQALVPEAGQYLNLFSLKEPEVVQAEALELALDRQLPHSIHGILNFTPVLTAGGAPITRPTVAERHAARAARLDAALQVAATLKGGSVQEMGMLLSMPR